MKYSLSELIRLASEDLSCVIDITDMTYQAAGNGRATHESLIMNPNHGFLVLGRHGYRFNEAYNVGHRIIQYFEEKLGIEITEVL
jgi:hypothetical protein